METKQLLEQAIDKLIVLYEEGRYDECLLYCDRVIELLPDCSDAYFVRALASSKTGDWNKSTESFKMAKEYTEKEINENRQV